MRVKKEQNLFAEKRLLFDVMRNPDQKTESPESKPESKPEIKEDKKLPEKPLPPELAQVETALTARIELAGHVKPPVVSANKPSEIKPIETKPPQHTALTQDLSDNPTVDSGKKARTDRPPLSTETPTPSSSPHPVDSANPSSDNTSSLTNGLTGTVDKITHGISGFIGPLAAMIGPLMEKLGPLLEQLRSFWDKIRAAMGDKEAAERLSGKTDVPPESTEEPLPEAVSSPTPSPLQGVSTNPLPTPSVAPPTIASSTPASSASSPSAQVPSGLVTTPPLAPIPLTAKPAEKPLKIPGKFNEMYPKIMEMTDPKKAEGIPDYEGDDDESPARAGLEGLLLAYAVTQGDTAAAKKFNEAKKLYDSTAGILNDQMFKENHLMEGMGLNPHFKALSSLETKDYRLKGYLAGLLQIAEEKLYVPNKNEILLAYKDMLIKTFGGLSEEARAGKMKDIMTIEEFAEKYNAGTVVAPSRAETSTS